ncbi:MAG: magnesium transporter CorA family protein [Candidatus Shapirobacteria bacterium]|nr:magnesium transporter CorA family protein [Candidatus Shapirobacteria bacterium]
MTKNIFKNWVYVENPTDEEIKKLVKTFKLDESLIRDALDPFEVSRSEKDNGKIYFFARTPLPINKDLMLTVPILFVLGKNFLITITPKELPIFEKFFKVKNHKQTIIGLFIKIFEEIINTYNSSLILINREIWQASTNVEKINSKDIAQFVNYERITNDYLSRLIQNGSILNQLNNPKYIKLNEDESEAAEDLVLNNNQLIDVSKNSLQSVKNIRDAYSTILSNDLNRVIKLLTSLTIILNVPTMIAGLWGMNVQVPFAKTIYGFGIVLILVLIISIILIKIFRKKDWL